MAVTTDPRFSTAGWTEADLSAPGPSRSPSSSREPSPAPEESDDDEELVQDDDDDDVLPEDDEESATVVKGLTPKELEAFERKQRKRGIIYISRIPPGMTVPKVRHLLSGFGQVERIFLQDGRKKEREAETGKKQSRRGTQFTEGWVEFSKKSVAKIVAQTLNAQPIGFSSGGRSANKNARRWKDDVWTMKYLTGFKWHMLTEQMAHERAAHASRLRTELSQSRFEQQDYLKKVERARVQRDKEEKRRLRAERSQLPAVETVTDRASSAPGGKMRTFKQRQPVLKDVRDQREQDRLSNKRSRETEKAQEVSSKKSKSGDGSAASQGALSGVLSRVL